MKNNTHQLVSVIITTKNEENNLKNCLESIKKQSYHDLEVIVVDNNSIDKTKDIAKKYTKLVFNKGPERSAQRNFGAKKAKGKYLLFLDADMILTKDVIKKCIEKVTKDKNVSALVIPEKSFGEGFWAQCKALERSFYIGNRLIEAPRFFLKSLFVNIGGYDISLISAEDWELKERIKSKGNIDRISLYVLHNEGKLSLRNTIRKKIYYAKNYSKYEIKQKNNQKSIIILERYRLFFSKPKLLFKNPLISAGMLFMKSCEFFFGGLGYLIKS